MNPQTELDSPQDLSTATWVFCFVFVVFADFSGHKISASLQNHLKPNFKRIFIWSFLHVLRKMHKIIHIFYNVYTSKTTCENVVLSL